MSAMDCCASWRSLARVAAALTVFWLLGGLAPRAYSADLWLFAPDPALRDRLLRARDGGEANAPTMMWPVTAAVVRSAGIDVPACRPSARVDAQAHEGERLILGFGDGVAVDRAGSLAICLGGSGPVLAWVQANAQQTGERRRVHADGSYVATVWQGVLVTAGAIERYWGPAWAGSLILGDNARPVPSLSIRRADSSRAFESRWLSWLGAWDAEFLVGQLQGHVQPRSPRFFAMRVEAAPLPWLTFGLSRTSQWGGAGRSNSLRTFWSALLGRDNLGASGISDANEPGNQLAGYDARLSLARAGVPLAVYAQWIGEDEAGYLPSKFIGAAGAEAWFEHARWRWRVAVEYVDTVVGKNDEFPGTAYRHHIYRQGYTQHGRVLGFGLGGDIRAAVLQAHAFSSGPWSGSVHLLRGNANPGGVADLPFAARSPLRAEEVRARWTPASSLQLEARLGRSRYTRSGEAPIREVVGGVRVAIAAP